MQFLSLCKYVIVETLLAKVFNNEFSMNMQLYRRFGFCVNGKDLLWHSQAVNLENFVDGIGFSIGIYCPLQAYLVSI